MVQNLSDRLAKMDNDNILMRSELENELELLKREKNTVDKQLELLKDERTLVADRLQSLDTKMLSPRTCISVSTILKFSRT